MLVTRTDILKIDREGGENVEGREELGTRIGEEIWRKKILWIILPCSENFKIIPLMHY